MKNKLIVTLLTIVLIASFGFACSKPSDNSSKPASITLVDFESTKTEEAILYGELYELRRFVTDEEGNEYSLIYQVKDSTGAIVVVIANCFEAIDLGGYTITYTAEVADGDVRTSVVTLPVYDGEGPSIIVSALDAGEVNVPYVLPEIAFNDLTEIVEKSVKVYLVGEELTEIALTETDGKYGFTPTLEGTYRLSVYAKDVAGNETTVTKEFFVEKILVGEILNPVSSKAQAQVYFGSNSNVFVGSKKEIVTAEENTDTTYGGSYMRVEAANPNNAWGNIFVDPRFEASEYASFELVTFWIYMESTDILPINVLFFNDSSLTKSVNANEWTLVTIEATKFFELLDTTYFIAARYNDKTTGIRISEILAVNPAELSISVAEQNVLNGESANVEFSVTANPANTECVVSVLNASGEALEVVSLGNGKYQVAVSAFGEYYVTASATNGKHGVANAKFEVVNANRILVDGEYAKAIGVGKEIQLLGARVQRGDEISDEAVTVKLYALNGEEWIDVSIEIVDGKYVTKGEGKIKIEYSCDDILPVSYEMEVLDYSVIFNPALEGADSYVMFGINNDVFEFAEKVFVTAEDNTDETYGGAYFSATATNRNNWGNIWVMPKYTAEDYAEYDFVTAWIYVVSGDDTPVTALLAYNLNTQTVAVNKWIQVVIPMETYISSIATGTPVFIALNYKTTAVTGVNIGEISAVHNAELAISADSEVVLDGERATLEFSVTANPANVEYNIAVTNQAGEALEVSALGNGKYQVVVSALGKYSINVSAINGYYGFAQTEFAVVESVRIVVDGKYNETVGLGKELAISSAHVERGESVTEEVVTIKLYALNGEEWVDVTAEIADGKYIPTSEGKIKVEYTCEGVESIECEIQVCDYSVVFNPALADASKVTFSTNNNVYENAAKVFVSAEENTDETYGGAYLTVSATNRNNWGNLWIYSAYGADEYQEFDYAVAWIYVVSENNNDVTALFALNTYTQVVTANQWVQVAIPMDAYISSIATGTPVFIALNYKNTGVTGVRIGDVVATNTAELAISTDAEVVLDGESVNVQFSVSANPAEAEYIVSVKNALGEALQVVALGEGKYQVAVSATGEYTISAIATKGAYGVASAQFTVIESVRLIVDGEYAKTVGFGEELAIIGAHIERGESATDEAVTVKLYALSGEEWIDISSEIAEGKYIPTAEGRIKVEYSFEGLDTIVYEIAVVDPRVVFNPTAENMSQISANGKAFNYGNSAVYTFVSDEENTDETYGGAYVKINSSNLPASTVWGNVLLAPARDASTYSKYDAVEIWLYVERNGSGDELVSFFGTLSGSNVAWATTATVTANKWVRVQLPMEQFIANQEYFFGRNLNANASWGVIGFRVGQVSAVNTAEVAISDIEESVLEGESVNVEFTVTANPAETELAVSVVSALGEALQVVALGGGKYQVAVSAIGEYTVIAQATGDIRGEAQAKFTVVESVRLIVDGEYAQTVGMGKQLTIIGAHIQRGQTATDEVVTVKLFALDGEEWVEVTSEIVEGKYVHAVEGKLKVQYSFEGLDSIEYQIDVCDYSILFDPALESAASQVMYGTNNTVFQNAEKAFVSAEENTDETYGGAYLKAIPTNRINWGNVFVTPKYSTEAFAEYDVVTAWIKVLADDNTPVTALFALNAYTQVVAVNQWIQVAIPMDVYVTSVASGTPVFIALNYKATASGVCIGEIKAANTAELAISTESEFVLESESVNVQFSVSANPAEAEYIVSVKNALGEALEVVALGEGKYQVAVTAAGNYTINASAINGVYGVASAQFTVIDLVRVFVDGEYASTIGAGSELTILGAHVERGETTTDEVVTVKLYALNGEEWLDVTAEIVDGKYLPVTESKLKVEYSFEGVDSIIFEIAVLDPSIIFDPTAENMQAQITTSGVGFGHGENAIYTFVSDEENTDETYGGSYVKINSNVLVAGTNKWGSVMLNSANDINSYSEYDAIEMWVYLERNGTGEDLVSFFGSLAGNNIAWATSATLASNQWIKLQFPIEQFIANPAYLLGRNLNGNTSWGVIGFRVGKITAVNVAEEPEDNNYYVFKPVAENLAQLNCTTGAGFTNNQATFEFVSAANNNNETYGGAYVKISTTALSSTGNKWGDICLTPEHDLSSYAEYTNILVWICVQSNASSAFTYSLYGGIASQSVVDNTWVQISIPAEAFVNKTSDILYALNFNNNASWGRTAVLIGEIIAVK